MDELRFVLKGLVFAFLVVMGLQIKVGGETLEMKSSRWVHSSSVGSFLNQSAQGAVEMTQTVARVTSRFIKDKLGSTHDSSVLNRASSNRARPEDQESDEE